MKLPRLASRLLEAALTLWLLLSLCFVLLRLAPGGPFDGERAAPPEIEAALAQAYRLDAPLWQQYVDWFGGLLRGDLGPSFTYPDQQVGDLILQALPVTLITGGLALLLAIALALPLGWLAARAHGRWPDRLLMGVSGLGLALPKYVVAPLLVLLFAVLLKLLPAGGWGRIDQLVLPVLALSLPNLAYAARLVRAGLLEAWESDWYRAARARGLPSSSLLLRHAAPVALLPLLAWIAPAAINLLSGSAVVEQIFGLPGLGRYFVQGALNRDYTLVLGVVATVGVGIVLVNAAVDGLRARIEQRES
ncbi:ABC transporter permease subunit [uncultured Aquimonas sp.]|uniref:ABC transporter permease subunit n=1 Tax=uncultured Aquimonas sp. TaxID=385483 RepID=UPI00086879BF|nr:ABC transporter permease subunit [uncultured Aquimonas sp.]ODU44648.1 MAG: oligopeptide transporter permease [Xanthomonadaceae bacterium SCN 69-123]